MKRIGLCFAVTFLFASVGWSQGPGKSHSETMAQNNASGNCWTLTVLFQGPFVFREASNNLDLLIPDLRPFHEPLRIGEEPLPPGAYDFQIGKTCGSGHKISNPVGGTAILWANPGSGTPSLAHYDVNLPQPTVIVPWNADPLEMQDADGKVSRNRYATMIAFQYEVQDLSAIKLIQSGRSFSPKLSILGWNPNHAFMSFWVEPIFEEDPMHENARNAFDAMQKMVGTKLTLRFEEPEDGYTDKDGRNMPILKGKLPQTVLRKLETFSRAWVIPSRPPVSMKFGPQNDCRAPQLYVSSLNVNDYK